MRRRKAGGGRGQGSGNRRNKHRAESIGCKVQGVDVSIDLNVLNESREAG
jgi:hypothetical protein